MGQYRTRLPHFFGGLSYELVTDTGSRSNHARYQFSFPSYTPAIHSQPPSSFPYCIFAPSSTNSFLAHAARVGDKVKTQLRGRRACDKFGEHGGCKLKVEVVGVDMDTSKIL